MKTMQDHSDDHRAFFRDWMDNPSKYPDDFLGLPLDHDMISGIFSKERVRLLRTLREDGPFRSLHALADVVGRNYSSVSRDVNYLEGSGLIQVEKVGRQKRIAWSGRLIVIG